jgi:spore protease
MDILEIKTDLALETRESSEGNEAQISGVSIEERSLPDIRISVVEISNKQGAEMMRKPIGKYITLEMNEDIIQIDKSNVVDVLTREIKNLLPEKIKGSILVVGLGNREVTPDALGPKVIEGLRVDRHIIKENGICAIAPGVMAQSGMESSEYVKGIVNEIDIDCIIAIDSLATRSVKRLCNTIQLTDTGIYPGSGVGNYRNAITKETMNIPVIAIGVPMVVDAATIVSDTMDMLLRKLSVNRAFNMINKSLENFDDEEKYLLAKELLEEQIGTLYVTPKDIDENVNIMGEIVSSAINGINET